MIQTYKVTIPELTGLKKKRRVYIYLPDSYEEYRDRRYPVLYMFDGQNVFFDKDASFGKSWGLKDFLEYDETQLIVVAIECNNNPNNGRLKEYAPVSFYDRDCGWITGKGEKTMDWLINELKPRVDISYRTLPFRETTFIAGSSMGGLMTLFAVCCYNDYFSRGAALSPSLDTNSRFIIGMLKEAELRPDTLVYMDYGEREFEGFEWVRNSFATACSIMIRKGIRCDFRIIPEGEHTEASWEKQNPYFISSLMYGIE